MNSREKIGLLVAEFRKKKGISTRELAKLSGVNYTNIGKLERGVYNVSIDILEKICEPLDVEIHLVEHQQVNSTNY